VVDPPPRLYESAALSAGRDPETVRRAVQIAGEVGSHGAHPVYTLSHLARLTGAPWRYLRDVVARRRDPYFGVVRRKRDGTTRPISSPEPFLMDAQRWILHNVAEACEVHEASYAYQRDRSILQCARAHVGARWLIKMDIHDFFESIGEGRVFHLFLDE
jgi:RNA-directed DNA polymerase